MKETKTAQFHLFEEIKPRPWDVLTLTKRTNGCFLQKYKLYAMFVLSDDSKFDSSDASHAVTAADNTLKYAFTHCACCVCTPYPFWSHGKTWLPPLLNIDVLSGLRWVNKSWNTDNTAFTEMESRQTFAVCDAWMLRQEWECMRARSMHVSIDNSFLNWWKELSMRDPCNQSTSRNYPTFFISWFLMHMTVLPF